MPAAIASVGRRWVAAITRTSMATGSVPPRGWTSRSWMTRRSLACSAVGSSPISSSRSEPPWASRNTPRWASSAPVNAPRLWPNSWLSTSEGAAVEGRAVVAAEVAYDVAARVVAPGDLEVRARYGRVPDRAIAAPAEEEGVAVDHAGRCEGAREHDREATRARGGHRAGAA